MRAQRLIDLALDLLVFGGDLDDEIGRVGDAVLPLLRNEALVAQSA